MKGAAKAIVEMHNEHAEDHILDDGYDTKGDLYHLKIGVEGYEDLDPYNLCLQAMHDDECKAHNITVHIDLPSTVTELLQV